MESIITTVTKLREILAMLAHLEEKEKDVEKLLEKEIRIWEEDVPLASRDLYVGEVKVPELFSFLRGEETKDKSASLALLSNSYEACLYFKYRSESIKLVYRGEVKVRDLVLLTALEAKNPGILDKVISLLKKEDNVLTSLLERLKNAVALCELALK